MEAPPAQDSVDLSKAFIALIRLLIRNFREILITIVLCLALGSLYYWLAPRTFESKMIIQSDILSESYALKLAENLDAHVHNKDYEFLATKLNITSKEASQLGQFKIVSALTPMSQQMAEKDKIIVVISVIVQDNALLPKLQTGIIQYLTNNEYIRKRVDENRKKYERLIAALDRELMTIDTLKTKIRNGTFASGKVGGVAILDVSGLYGVTALLLEKRSDLVYDLATVDSVQVVEDFTPYGKPVWPKLSIVLLTSLVLSGCIIFALITYRSLYSQMSN